jgi:hypothetical protein
MKNHIVYVVICAAFLFGVWCETVLCQIKPVPQVQQLPKSTKELQLAAISNFKPNVFPDIIKWGDDKGELQRVALDQTTGEVWLVAVRHKPSDQLGQAQVGYTSNSLENTGTTDWKGVTISATFQVYKCQGSVAISIGRAEPANYGWWGNKDITAPGTYTVTSLPFDMKPNVKYWGRALVFVPGDPPLNVVHNFYGKVTNIKFIFP